jgi:hypothetical protein
LTTKKIISTIISLTLFILILIGILYFGPLGQKELEKSFRKGIDKNGYITKALVSEKRYLKGHYVVYRFYYKGENYKNKEQSNELYESLNIGDSIDIRIDSTNPDDSYILTEPIKWK